MRIVRGDGGIDAHEGSLADPAGVDVYQVKCFPHGLGESQKTRSASRSRLRETAFTKPVRLLLVERGYDSWWTTFSREESQSESGVIAAFRHSEPRDLPQLAPEAILQLAEEVVRSRHGTWNATVAREFLLRLCSYDRCVRPLFAMIVAKYLECVESTGLVRTFYELSSRERRRGGET